MYQKDQVSAELANFDKLPDTANVRLPTVKQLYGVSAATVWRLSGKTIPGELRAALGVKKGA